MKCQNMLSRKNKQYYNMPSPEIFFSQHATCKWEWRTKKKKTNKKKKQKKNKKTKNNITIILADSNCSVFKASFRFLTNMSTN